MESFLENLLANVIGVTDSSSFLESDHQKRFVWVQLCDTGNKIK